MAYDLGLAERLSGIVRKAPPLREEDVWWPWLAAEREHVSRHI